MERAPPTQGKCYHGGMSSTQGNCRRKPTYVPSVTAEALERAATHYLERYASSRENLRRVLMRRVWRAAHAGTIETAAGQALVDAVIERYAASGLLDDKSYAEHKAAGLVRAGASRHQIRGKLRQKGVASEAIDGAIAGLEREGANDTAAACAFIRRRRLGPYRPAATHGTFRLKDLAALARAGFGFDLAKRLLTATSPDDLDRLAREE
jgi:regulatory protein